MRIALDPTHSHTSVANQWAMEIMVQVPQELVYGERYGIDYGKETWCETAHRILENSYDAEPVIGVEEHPSVAE